MRMEKRSFSRRRFLAGSVSGVSLGIAGVTGSGLLSSHPNKCFGCLPDRLTTNMAAATVHPLATRGAMEAMRQGGNAIDAAIAAGLVLGVVDGHNSGLGGGCLINVRLANGKMLAIDGRETAGAAAHAKMFVRNGKADASLSQTGPLASAVPSQLAAMHRLHRDFGRLRWDQLFGWAIAAAENGMPVSKSTARTLAAEKDDLGKFSASKEIYIKRDGSTPSEGEILVQRDLASTLKAIAKNGPEWFYRGPFAKSCCEYLANLGGILTEKDFSEYQPVDRSPVITKYRGLSVVGFPPPSSGGYHIAQMLSMLEAYPLKDWYENNPTLYYHLLAETMKRAFADRAFWLGDSDFAPVPESLLDPAYLQARMKDFSTTAATLGIERGSPPGADASRFGTAPGDGADPKNGPDDSGKHTTHLTTADQEGNWVAMTCTVNTSWGSKVTVPGTGVMLNNQMDDFSIAPGTPNAFGLVGSQANAVEARKRPLSSMSPTMVLDAENRPWLTCGAAGGPKIINATLQVLLRVIDLGQLIDVAIAAPRVHHQWRPDQLQLESSVGAGTPYAISAETIDGLKGLGHPLKEASGLAIAQGIQRRGDRLIAAHDPRAQGLSEA